MSRTGRFPNKLIYQWFFLLMLFLLVFMSYWNNVFHLVDEDWFLTWQIDSEWSVWDRIYDDNYYGFSHNAGLLGECRYNEIYTYDPNHDVYTAQMGMQGFIFGFLFKYFHFTKSHLYFAETLIVIICLVALAWWIWKEFGYGTAVGYTVLLLFNQWLTVAARNLYHVVWTMLFPFLCTLFILRYAEKTEKKVNKQLFLWGFISIFIKCACGYEYISLVMINLELPVFYYAFKNRWKRNRSLLYFLELGIASMCAFICSIIGVTIQNNYYLKKGILNAFREFLYHVLYRTGIGGSEQFEGIIRESLEASRISILRAYFADGRPVLFQWNMNVMIVFIMAGMLVCLIDTKYCKEINVLRHKLLSLALLVLVALLGPLSWMILAKGHAYIHMHIIYVIWSLPFLLLGEVLVIRSVGTVIISYMKTNKKLAAVAMAIILLLWFAVYYDMHFPIVSEYKRVVEDGREVYTNETDTLIFYENKLYYLTDSKDENYYFLHFYKTEWSEEFYNHDFAFNDRKIQLPFWYRRRMAKVELPGDYEIQKIQTGCLDERRIERVWETTLKRDILNLQGE